MGIEEEITFRDLQRYAQRGTREWISIAHVRWTKVPPSYEEFVRAVETALGFVVRTMVRNPKLYYRDVANRVPMLEDQISHLLVRDLVSLGFDALLDSTVGGHCDVVVRYGSDYLWLGEAKIDSGNQWLWQGYQQLTTRYSPGDTQSACGGLLIYCFKRRTDQRMESWMERLASEGCQTAICDEPIAPNAFRSSQLSERTGVELQVLHVPISLMFAPQDVREK